MKPTLHINVSQQLILTPQLQQAIRLMQLSTLDLQQEIQHQLESNPMLDADPSEAPAMPQEEMNQAMDEFSDFQWQHLYQARNEDDFDYVNLYATPLSLKDHLRWQLELVPITNIDKAIAEAIIDAIDDDGFLTASVKDIHDCLNSKNYPLDLAEIEAVRHRIQHLDPIGCASINLSETLLLQLQQLPNDTVDLELAKKIVKENIDLLGKHLYNKLMSIYHINEKAIENVLHLIQHLNPKPGSVIYQSRLEHIAPDLAVKKEGNKWHVELNTNALPHLSINNYYASLIRQAKNQRDGQFLKNNLQEARWFLKSIQNRQETLLKVARYIVDYQKEFLEYGEEAMKPLILHDVAHALNMHESTISRITTQKYIYTPRGLFELKYFFSSHIPTTIGGECSSIAIKAVIKKLIAAENSAKPLSDSKITKLINEQGIKVARRTVAKYREELSIASSSERKVISIKTNHGADWA